VIPLCRKAKCIWLVHAHAELNVLLFGVLQSSILRRQSVPENSVSLSCCHEAVGMSDLPKTLMELIGNVTSQTFLDDLLKLSYNVATASDQSGKLWIQYYRIVDRKTNHFSETTVRVYLKDILYNTFILEIIDSTAVDLLRKRKYCNIGGSHRN